jgi:3-deoxy-7-phosphoheptulonate synthase
VLDPRPRPGDRVRDRLKASADELRDDLLIVMRAYFEKPRTTVGWKGYINDPHLDGSFAINEGLERARRLLLELTNAGPADRHRVPRPAEPAVHRRPDRLGRDRRAHDESQSHRQLASGLSCRSASRTAPTAASRSRPTRSSRRVRRTPSWG